MESATSAMLCHVASATLRNDENNIMLCVEEAGDAAGTHKRPELLSSQSLCARLCDPGQSKASGSDVQTNDFDSKQARQVPPSLPLIMTFFEAIWLLAENIGSVQKQEKAT